MKVQVVVSWYRKHATRIQIAVASVWCVLGLGGGGLCGLDEEPSVVRSPGRFCAVVSVFYGPLGRAILCVDLLRWR